MSDILEIIKTRRSVRKYKSDMVPTDIIDKIVEAGTYAATGSHLLYSLLPIRSLEISFLR